jgi:hypothetical protein
MGHACEPGRSLEEIDRLRLTIFQQDWWLKIARGSARLKEVQVHGANGVVIGSLTYIVQHNVLGIPSGRAPHLSRVSGPIVSKNLSEEEKSIVFTRLIKELPNISFTFHVAEHAPDAYLITEAFKHAGFECFERIIYSQPPGNVTNRLGTQLRKHTKQALNTVSLIDIDPNTFINFYRANLEAENKNSSFPLDVAERLIAAGIDRDPPQAHIIAASKTVSGQSSDQPVLNAAVCIVWDKERCYYWLSTRRKGCHPDTIKLLITMAMKQATELGLIFDADCHSTPGTQRLFKTIFRMTNDEKRYTFTRTSRLSQLYEAQRSKIDKIKAFAIALGLR